MFVFAIDDLGGANIYPAIWSLLLAARAEGVGGVMTMVLRNVEDRVNELLRVPVGQGWKMSAMLALGYPRGKWGVAANRRPVQEVSSRNRWDAPFGVEVPQPLWPLSPSRRQIQRRRHIHSWGASTGSPDNRTHTGSPETRNSSPWLCGQTADTLVRVRSDTDRGRPEEMLSLGNSFIQNPYVRYQRRCRQGPPEPVLMWGAPARSRRVRAR